MAGIENRHPRVTTHAFGGDGNEHFGEVLFRIGHLDSRQPGACRLGERAKALAWPGAARH